MARSVETEEKFRRYAAVLNAHGQACDELLAQVDEVLALFSWLKEQHCTVSSRTAALQDTCERLVAERRCVC